MDSLVITNRKRVQADLQIDRERLFPKWEEIANEAWKTKNDRDVARKYKWEFNIGTAEGQRTLKSAAKKVAVFKKKIRTEKIVDHRFVAKK